ncbi:MAG TPA: GntR family transcriptional regulator [Leptolinea sp.]
MPARVRTVNDIPLTPADPASPIPLYHQIYMDLLNLIQTNQLMPDDLMPPEMELMKVYNVSRQTLRDAMELLEKEKLIKRTAGKGTVVLAAQNRIQFIMSQSFAMQMHTMGYKPGSKVLKLNPCIIDQKSPAKLQCKMGSPALELVRLRFANDEPIGVQYTTIVIDSMRDLAENDFNNESLYNLLLTKYRLPINQIDYAVSAVTADPWHQVLLKLEKAEPLLLIQTLTYLDNGSPIEVTASFYRADRFEFTNSQKF